MAHNLLNPSELKASFPKESLSIIRNLGAEEPPFFHGLEEAGEHCRAE